MQNGFFVKVSGIPRVTQETTRLGDKVGGDLTNNDLDVTVKLGDKLGNKLGNNQQLILAAIKHNSHISLSQLSKIVGISQTAIENNVTNLKKIGMLKRIGSTKSGYWKVNS